MKPKFPFFCYSKASYRTGTSILKSIPSVGFEHIVAISIVVLFGHVSFQAVIGLVCTSITISSDLNFSIMLIPVAVTVIPVVFVTIISEPFIMPRLIFIHVVTVLRLLLHQNNLSLVKGLNRSEIVADILAIMGGQLSQFFQVAF